jgi:hypothetical protein
VRYEAFSRVHLRTRTRRATFRARTLHRKCLFCIRRERAFCGDAAVVSYGGQNGPEDETPFVSTNHAWTLFNRADFFAIRCPAALSGSPLWAGLRRRHKPFFTDHSVTGRKRIRRPRRFAVQLALHTSHQLLLTDRTLTAGRPWLSRPDIAAHHPRS